MKRTLDIIVGSVGLLLLSPILGAVALLVLARMGRPVFFRQERTGLGGQVFKIIKFRTMSDDVSTDGTLLGDAHRLTGLGLFLRRTSIDELPTLINVLRGDMSLVGPRPLLVDYLPLYSERQARRHEVAPGITGWAQINGRNAISWEKKFDLDVWYVENRSFWLDLKILMLTIVSVVARRGISQPGEATMEYFTRGKDGNSH